MLNIILENIAFLAGLREMCFKLALLNLHKVCCRKDCPVEILRDDI